jgi:aminopeptidase N
MYYVPPDRVDEVRPTFRNTTAMLDFFSDALGMKYPWAKYAQVCGHNFGGGMENTSATTLGTRALRDERALPDGDADGLIAHELAHQWFGDLVTCRDWAHLWLNEGFASYFEALWDEHNLGAQEFADNMAGKQRSAIRGGKKLPIVDRAYEDPDAQFDSRAYPKGAWVVHMLRRRLGDELFWKSLNAYLTEYRHQPVETDDLRRTIERVSGRSFERFFYDWTERPGAPEVKLEYSWNEADGVAELSVEQTQEADAFEFPLVIELVMTKRDDSVVLRRELTSKSERFLIPLASRPVRLAVDPHQEVLMDLTETKPRDMWIAQLRDDPNPAARISAAKELVKDESDATRALFAEALGRDDYWGVRVELAEQLAKLGGDAAREALLASLGHEDARVRKACVAGLAAFDADQRLEAPIRQIIDADTESYGVTAAAINTLAKWKPDDLMAKIEPLLQRDSPNERIRSAAIKAIGEAGDASSVDMLLGYTAPEKDSALRRAAVSALEKVVKRVDLDDEPRQRVVNVIATGLTEDSRRTRARAAGALGNLGEKAVGALPQLREALEQEKNERTKEAIASAIEKIGPEASDEEPAVVVAEASGDAAASGDGAEEAAAGENDMIAALREENALLCKRIDSLEAAVNGLETLVRRLSSRDNHAAAASTGDPASSTSNSVPIGASAP